MCHADLWNQIVVNLKTAGMWDHVHVITMGDMCQLPPPNKYKALYEDFVLKAQNPQTFASKLTRLNGIKSFATMKKVELTVQKRAENDLDHCQRITQLRTGEIDDNIINGFKPLTREDTQNGWEFVPILVTSNCERVLINRCEYGMSDYCVIMCVNLRVRDTASGCVCSNLESRCFVKSGLSVGVMCVSLYVSGLRVVVGVSYACEPVCVRVTRCCGRC